MIFRLTKILLYLALLIISGLLVRACSAASPQPEPTRVVSLPPTTTPLPPLDLSEQESPTVAAPTETAPAPSVTPVPAEDTATPEVEDTATPEPEDTPTLEPENTATPEAEDTATPEADTASASSDNCVGCHTSQETLEALAEDKAVVSDATEGEG
jgi:hypothetical protein